MLSGFFESGDASDPTAQTPEAIARRRKLADALIAKGTDTSEVRHWTQGAARLVSALMGGYQAGQIDREEKAARSHANQALARALIGDTAGAQPGSSSPVAASGWNLPKSVPDPGAPPSPPRTAPAPQASNSGPGNNGGFAQSVARTLGFEGGLNPRDTNGAPSNFGINAKANPDVDVMNLTAESAKPLYKSRYWDTIGADNLPPALAHVAFDTSVIAGPGRAKEFLAQSGGDPNRFMELREQYLSGLVQQNPQKFGAYEKAWANRNAGLRSDLASFAPQGQPQQPLQVAQAGVTPDGMPMSPVASDAAPMSYAPNPAKMGITQNAQLPSARMNGADPQSAALPGGNPQPTGLQVAQSGGAPMPMPSAPPALSGGQQGNTASLMAAVSNPWLSESQRSIAMLALKERMSAEGVTFVDAGDRLIPMNKRGQQVGQPITKTREGADWQLVKDEAGNPIGRFNARTGVTEPLNSQLSQAGAKSPTVQRIKQPDGSEVAVQWDSRAGKWVPLDAPQGGNAVQSSLPKLTEGQSKDVGFYQRGLDANKGLTPDAERALTNAADVGLENAPGILGVRPGRMLQMPEFQTAHNSARNFLAVILRKDTGAAITKEEWTEYTPLFIPQPGDTSALIEQKRRNRGIALQAMKDGLGNVGDILDRVMSARNAAGSGSGATGANGPAVRVSTPDEARKLPRGTRIILPDGREGVVP